MKVIMTQTQLRGEKVVYQWEGLLPQDFEDLQSAIDWIGDWLDQKKKFLQELWISSTRDDTAIQWRGLDLIFIENYDISF